MNRMDARNEGGSSEQLTRSGRNHRLWRLIRPCWLKTHSLQQAYGTNEISERHPSSLRGQYRLSVSLLEVFGLRFSGVSPDGILPEIVEFRSPVVCRRRSSTQTEKSNPFDPHPLVFRRLHRAAVSKVDWSKHSGDSAFPAHVSWL